MRLTSYNNPLPMYRSTISVSGIPWEKIDYDLIHNSGPRPGYGDGVSTVDFNLRRDLEDWAKDYRQVQTTLVEIFMPFAKDQEYSNWLHTTWFNRTPPGGMTPVHEDNPCDITSVWYLDVPINGGNFILIYSGKEYVVPVKTGDFIAFPATIPHCTEINKSDKYRTIMGGNIAWHEKIKRDLSLLNIDTDAIDLLYRKRQQELTINMSNWYKQHESNIK